MEKHDFSDKLNIAELKLQNPQKVEKMNLWSTINHTLDIALASDKSAVIFGEDVTQVNKDNCPIPISRARLIQQLTKSNLF